MRKIHEWTNFRKWIDDSLKDLMTDRDRCKEKARMLGDMEDWKSYRKKRNLVIKETRKRKNNHFNKLYGKLALSNWSCRNSVPELNFRKVNLKETCQLVTSLGN